MKEKVLLIGYNFHPELTGIGKYSGEKIDWLLKQGHDCTVITSYPYYPHWKVQAPYTGNRFWFKTEKIKGLKGEGDLIIHRCPQYVPSSPTGFKRMFLEFTFTVSAFLKILQLLPGKKFDVVINIAPSFQTGLLGALYKKIRGAKLVYHIQDMQIEAAKELGMIKSETILNALYSIERFIFKRANIISSISEGMVDKIQLKAGRSVSLFPNWVDTKKFFPNEYKLLLKARFGFKAADRVILYSGAVGEKQGLEVILKIADDLKSDPTLKFIICGSGPYKSLLQKMARELVLKNIRFLPLQSSEDFNAFLNMADVHLVIQKSSAGDLVMPSKLTTIMAVGGVAVITANEGSTLFSVVNKYQMGIVVEAENKDALTKGILKALSSDRQILQDNARKYAKEFLCVDAVMTAFSAKVFRRKENLKTSSLSSELI